MRKMVWALLLGLCLTSSWAAEIQQEDTVNDRQAAIDASDPSNSDPEKFSNLVKSTMDLMGPTLEITQTAEKTNTQVAE